MLDAAGREPPRNPQGNRITLADFDMSMTSPGGAVAGLYIDRSHWSVCGCQGAPPGTQVSITASYPSKSLEEKLRVPGVEFQSTATFAVGAAKGAVNPPGCAETVARAPFAAASTTVMPFAPKN